MKEIRDKLAELAKAYQEQLDLYRQIEQVGSTEQDLINKGQLERLLEVLREKEELLKQAGSYELQIRSIQDQLVSHFGVSTFSLPQLKLAAPAYYQDELKTLEEMVAQLLPILESLEQQESSNEALLSQYLDRSQQVQPTTIQTKRASRAYGRKGS